MKSKVLNGFLTVFGLLLTGTGLFLIKFLSAAQGMPPALPYICIGVGCGAFGQGMGGIISRRALKNSPETQKQIEIAQKDERNLAISHRAKAKAYDMMLFVLGALMLSFALMGVDLMVVLLLVFCYLFIVGYGVYCRVKFEKEM